MYASKPDVLTTTTRLFADQVPRADRILQIQTALERGTYRIPSHVLSAYLMFEMIQ